MKKVLGLVLAAAMAMSCLTGCGKYEPGTYVEETGYYSNKDMGVTISKVKDGEYIEEGAVGNLSVFTQAYNFALARNKDEDDICYEFAEADSKDLVHLIVMSEPTRDRSMDDFADIMKKQYDDEQIMVQSIVSDETKSFGGGTARVIKIDGSMMLISWYEEIYIKEANDRFYYVIIRYPKNAESIAKSMLDGITF